MMRRQEEDRAPRTQKGAAAAVEEVERTAAVTEVERNAAVVEEEGIAAAVGARTAGEVQLERQEVLPGRLREEGGLCLAKTHLGTCHIVPLAKPSSHSLQCRSTGMPYVLAH
mmetsp:Transcript_47226/g.122045  ORF Transcript_47226/g.122045 Transcript_47226/m.122045 type:complete len:112 (-) Transcript_47226:598-933(-)